MQTYSIGACIKFLIGVIIMSILYKYVNVYESPMLGLSFGFLGTFMIVRGLVYFLFLGLYKLRSISTPHQRQTSLSYKLSLLFAVCTMINIALMINGKRSNILGMGIFAGFVLLIPIFAYEKTTHANH